DQITCLNVAQQAMKDRTVRFEIETLDVEQTSITGLHEHRYPGPSCRLSHQQLQIERIAFFDHDVEPVDESVDGRSRQAVGDQYQGEVGIKLRDPPADGHRLVDPQIHDRRRYPIEVRQLDGVEVGKAEFATDPLL